MNENVEIVRKPLRVRERSRRTLDQRLALRVPRLVAAGARLIGRLAPPSRLRQAFLWRAWRLGLEAYNRRDLEVVAVGFQPDLEYYPYREFVEAGLAEPCYHGPSGYRTYIEGTYEVWGADARVEPKELIDLGDRVVVLADMPMRAQASCVPLGETYACVATLKHGRVIRQRDFLDHAEALQAVGLQEYTSSQEEPSFVGSPTRPTSLILLASCHRPRREWLTRRFHRHRIVCLYSLQRRPS